MDHQVQSTQAALRHHPEYLTSPGGALPSWGSAFQDGGVPYNLLAVVARVLRARGVSFTMAGSQPILADLMTVHPEQTSA